MRRRSVPNKQITAWVPVTVAASLKRIAADLEEFDIKTHDGVKMMGGDIVGALIAYANSLPPSEKAKIFRSGDAEVKAMVERAAANMDAEAKEATKNGGAKKATKINDPQAKDL